MDGWAEHNLNNGSSDESVSAGSQQNGGGEPRGPSSPPSNGLGGEKVENAEFNGNAELKRWHPKELRPRHKLAIQLQACGLRNKEIAEMLGYTEGRISVILRDPRANLVREEMGSEVADKLDNVGLRLGFYANEALSKVVELMRTASSETVAQRSAFDILDRAGYTKVEKHVNLSANISDDKAKQLLGALDEVKNAVDADYSIED